MPDIEFLFHPDAEFEFVSAFQWYWDRNSQAANAFDDAVMAGIDYIRRNPSAWPRHIHGTQKYVVQKFPYNIIFRQRRTNIEVIAVAHQHRRPDYWASRLE